MYTDIFILKMGENRSKLQDLAKYIIIAEKFTKT